MNQQIKITVRYGNKQINAQHTVLLFVLINKRTTDIINRVNKSTVINKSTMLFIVLTNHRTIDIYQQMKLAVIKNTRGSVQVCMF